MKKFFFLIILLNSHNIIGQEIIKVNMSSELANPEIPGITQPALVQNTLEDYKGIPKYINSDSVWLSKIVFDREKYWFDKKNENTELVDYYKSKLKDYKIDTLKIPKFITKSYVGILTAVHNNKKIIIIDSNNNHDFSDEIETHYFFNNDTNFENAEVYKFQSTFNVQYESTDHKKLEQKNEYIQIVPFIRGYKFPNEIDSIKTVHYKINTFLKGRFSFGNEKFEVSAVNNSSVGLEKKTREFQFNITAGNNKLSNINWIKYNRKFKLGEVVFTILGFNDTFDSLEIEVRKANKQDYGWQEGDFIPTNDSLFSAVNKNNKKYLIFNFWGSWCGPCLKEIPDLIELNSKLKDSFFELINVSCEYDIENIKKAKKIVLENDLQWKQNYELMEKEGSFSNKMNITQFPTLFVVDNTGLILDRIIGLGNVEILKEKYGI